MGCLMSMDTNGILVGYEWDTFPNFNSLRNPWPLYFGELPDIFMVLFHRDVLN